MCKSAIWPTLLIEFPWTAAIACLYSCKIKRATNDEPKAQDRPGPHLEFGHDQKFLLCELIGTNGRPFYGWSEQNTEAGEHSNCNVNTSTIFNHCDKIKRWHSELCVNGKRKANDCQYLSLIFIRYLYAWVSYISFIKKKSDAFFALVLQL